MQKLGVNSVEQDGTKFINISKEQEVQVFAKQMLAKRVFVGHYQERRYVSPLNSYRDVVRVSDTEEDLKRDLETVKKRLQSVCSSGTWIGITEASMPGAPAGVSLWVTLKSVPLGHHWFQIREVRFLENCEVLVRLKCLRSLCADTSHGSAGEEAETAKAEEKAEDKKEKTPDENPLAGIIDFIKSIKYDLLLYEFVQNCYTLMTLENAKKVIAFLIVMIATSVTGFLHVVRYLGDFSLKLMRELSVLIHACTPLLLGILDLWSKIVGGLYLLLAMMWRDYHRPQPPGGRPLGRPEQLALPPSRFHIYPSVDRPGNR